MIVLRLSGGVEFCNMLNKIRNIKYGDKNKKKKKKERKKKKMRKKKKKENKRRKRPRVSVLERKR